MNRKTFIKKSVAGIAAAPFIAKGVREERICTIEVPTDSEVLIVVGPEETTIFPLANTTYPEWPVVNVSPHP